MTFKVGNTLESSTSICLTVAITQGFLRIHFRTPHIEARWLPSPCLRGSDFLITQAVFKTFPVASSTSIAELATMIATKFGLDASTQAAHAVLEVRAGTEGVAQRILDARLRSPLRASNGCHQTASLKCAKRTGRWTEGKMRIRWCTLWHDSIGPRRVVIWLYNCTRGTLQNDTTKETQ